MARLGGHSPDADEELEYDSDELLNYSGEDGEEDDLDEDGEEDGEEDEENEDEDDRSVDGIQDYSDVGEDGLDNGEEEDAEEKFARARAPMARYWTVGPEVKNRHHLAKLGAVCFLCGGADHRAGDCPDEVCLVCLGRGHRSRDCTSQQRITVCGMCGRVGHTRGSCPERGQPALDVSQCRCVACGALGHIDCSPYEQRPRRVSCLNCGQGGHTANECRESGSDRWHRLFASALGSVSPERRRV